MEEYEQRRKTREARSRKCPRCARRIRREATTCKHCGWGETEVKDFAQLDALDAVIGEVKEPEPAPKRKGLFGLFRRSQRRPRR